MTSVRAPEACEYCGGELDGADCTDLHADVADCADRLKGILDATRAALESQSLAIEARDRSHAELERAHEELADKLTAAIRRATDAEMHRDKAREAEEKLRDVANAALQRAERAEADFANCADVGRRIEAQRDAARRDVARMREALAWCVSVIEHEVEPPKSCGACGTPSAQCDGDCSSAYYHYDGMRKARAALATSKEPEGHTALCAAVLARDLEAARELLRRWIAHGFPMGAAPLWDDTKAFLSAPPAASPAQVTHMVQSLGEATARMLESAGVTLNAPPPPAPSALDVEAIRRRCDAATPGPWVKCAHGQAGHEDWWSVNRGVDTGRVVEAMPSQVARVMSHIRGAEDAAFIAHARTDIPALLAEIARLRAAATPDEGLTAEELRALAVYVGPNGHPPNIAAVVEKLRALASKARR